MVKIFSPTRPVADLAKAFVLSRRRGSVVSTGDAVKAIRYLALFCEHSDNELADVVGAIAISEGRGVAFDHRVSDSGELDAAQVRRAEGELSQEGRPRATVKVAPKCRGGR